MPNYNDGYKLTFHGAWAERLAPLPHAIITATHDSSSDTWGWRLLLPGGRKSKKILGVSKFQSNAHLISHRTNRFICATDRGISIADLSSGKESLIHLDQDAWRIEEIWESADGAIYFVEYKFTPTFSEQAIAFEKSGKSLPFRQTVAVLKRLLPLSSSVETVVRWTGSCRDDLPGPMEVLSLTPTICVQLNSLNLETARIQREIVFMDITSQRRMVTLPVKNYTSIYKAPNDDIYIWSPFDGGIAALSQDGDLKQISKKGKRPCASHDGNELLFINGRSLLHGKKNFSGTDEMEKILSIENDFAWSSCAWCKCNRHFAVAIRNKENAPAPSSILLMGDIVNKTMTFLHADVFSFDWAPKKMA